MHPRLPALLCAIVTFIGSGSSNAQRIDQPTDVVYKQEGESVTIDCKITFSFSYYIMYWYQQPTSGKMIYLTGLNSEGWSSKEGRYSVVFQKALEVLKLTISALTLSDSAVYFCTITIATVTVVTERALQKTPGLSNRQPPAPRA
ncbi:T-cell receptor alpha chain V region HPB-MLT [Heterocephalus glaber]|nr:T-cell receptor alpha chain V region HPB-MLT [Heterocephalus glaber]